MLFHIRDAWVKQKGLGLETICMDVNKGWLVLFLALVVLSLAPMALAQDGNQTGGNETNCTEDADCEEGYFCSEGECLEVVDECTEDADCAEGEVCTEGECVAEAECTEDADCEEGEVCTEGECLEVVILTVKNYITVTQENA
jgi:Cys-rich repeat protein